MSFLSDIKFQYYPADIEKCIAIGEVTLQEFIDAHRNPKKAILETFNKISKAAAVGDLKLKNELKKSLYYFTPSARFDGWRKYDNIVFPTTQVVQIDFDGITNAAELRDELFEKLSCVVCAYLSPSRLGCKMLIRVPACYSIEELKSYIYGLYSFLERYKGFDAAPANISLPLYLSHDADIKWRENPTVWSRKGIKVNEFDMTKFDPNYEATDELSKEDLLVVAERVKAVIMMADKEQVGHKNVVAGSLLAGSTASYYKNINEDKMFEYLISCIEECNYLQKNLQGYKKTAQTMYNSALNRPSEFKKDYGEN